MINSIKTYIIAKVTSISNFINRNVLSKIWVCKMNSSFVLLYDQIGYYLNNIIREVQGHTCLIPDISDYRIYRIKKLVPTYPIYAESTVSKALQTSAPET